MSAVIDRLVVITDPAVRFGRPNVGGVSVDAIASVIWAGDGVTDTAEDFNLTRSQVLLACWHVGTHGTPTWRKRWKTWTDTAHRHMWHNQWDQITDPPAKGNQTP